jgi:hypothetical protein
MEFISKVTQRLRQVRILSRFRKEDGLINTTDLLVATAATVVLAAGVGGAVLSTLDEANYGKAQPDAQAVAQAVMSFYKDTGKWPGQAEHALAQNTPHLVATGSFGFVDDPETLTVDESLEAFDLPSVANDGLEWAAQADCAANSGQGFVNGEIAAYASSEETAAITGVTVLNINNYLVRQPAASDYPNWKGPYVQEITTDPWERSWIAYLAPLYCSEVVSEASGAGNLGYAWLITGGTNRTITTPATSSNLDPEGDDAGVNLGKLAIRSSTVSQ